MVSDDINTSLDGTSFTTWNTPPVASDGVEINDMVSMTSNDTDPGMNKTLLYIPTSERVIEGLILTSICSLAFIGNLSLWLTVLRERFLRNTSNYLILSLSAADLLVSTLNMPVIVYTIANGDWTLGHDACQVLGFSAMITFVCSVMSLGCISINRYFHICHPSLFKSLYTPRNTGFFIAGTWLISAALSSPPLLGWGRYGYLPGQSFCFADWPTSKSYTIFMVATCFGGPCSVMSFCYFNILRAVRESKRKLGAFSQTRRLSQVSMTKRSQKNRKGHVNQVASQEDRKGELDKVVPDKHQQAVLDRETEKAKRRRAEEIRLTTSFLVVIFCFVICWLPFCIAMFWNVFGKSKPPRAFDIATLLLGCANSACNPIIYGVMNSQFRRGYKRLYCRGFGRTVSGTDSATLEVSMRGPSK